MAEVSFHIIVKGMVQGVGFRYFVYRRAMELKLGGFVRNLPDGTVEVVATGQRAMAEELIRYIKVGPRGSTVNDLLIEIRSEAGEEKYFEIK